MNTTLLKLVTIIAEETLEDKLIADLKALGATGYTIGKVRGEGSHRPRTSEWEGENIRIEVIVPASVAAKILDRLAEIYFPTYSVVGYAVAIEVVRGDKYAP